MSSDGSSAAGQGSRLHRRESRTPMQAAKLSETPELEESSSLAKTAKTGMPVSWYDDQVPRPPLVQLRGLILVLGVLVLWLQQEEGLSLVLLLTIESWRWRGLFLVPLMLAVMLPVMLPHMFPLWWKDVVMLVLVQLVVFRLILERIVNFWTARIYGHAAKRLRKWGPHEWVLDSGAWIHHTSKLELLIDADDFQEMDNKDDALSSIYVVGRGSVRTGSFDFPGVHYVVADDTRNVVSVSQLARDHGLVTIFEPTSCHVKDKKTGHIIGKGHLHDGMYMLDFLRINGQYIGGEGASSGGQRGDGGGGGRGQEGGGNKGEEDDSGVDERRGGGGQSKDGMGGGTGASRNQEQGGSGGGAAGGDINDEEIVTEEEGSSKNEIQEMNGENVDQDDNGKVRQEIIGNGEEDKNRGGGGGGGGSKSSNKARMGLFGLSPFVLVLCLCIAACISLLLCTSRWTRVICKLAFNSIWFPSLLELALFFILGFPLSRTLSMMQTISRKVEQIGSLFRGRRRNGDNREGGDYVQESSHQEYRRLFGLSRFDVSTDPTGYQLPAGAFPSSTNFAPRREEFLVDSGASFHVTRSELILFPYAPHLQDDTKPPTRSLGGIVGSIEVTRSGYLNGDNIMIDGVLLAPESRMNLISVGQLSVQYGVRVEMDHVGVVIRKQQDGVPIGGGRMHNNHLYVLEYFDPPRGLFAHLHTPPPNVFGRRPPGPAQ